MGLSVGPTWQGHRLMAPAVGRFPSTAINWREITSRWRMANQPGNGGDKSRRGGENSSDRHIGNTDRRQVGHVGRVRELVRALERGIGSGGSAGASSTHSKGPGRSGTTSGR